jgi:ATP-dependent protease HslVU (ClpYQ) peptidase subunit
MTTIAYTNRVLACDSCYSAVNVIWTRAPKIKRLSTGALIGFSGDTDARAMMDLFDRVKTEKQLPTRKQILDLQFDTDALFIMRSGRIFNVECGYNEGHWEGGLYEWGERFAATGSGGKFALVAMECGKTAVEAVHMACRRDINSCPPVHQLSLIVDAKRKAAPSRKR